MPRYRAMDARNQPEMQHLMIDFDLPILSSSGVIEPLISSRNSSDTDFKSSPRKSPLVHVFLIQESMGSDVLRAAIEGVSSVIKDMHDDSHVVLSTYSNRLGVFRCSLDGPEGAPTQPVVQYAHFHVADDSLGVNISSKSCTYFDILTLF